MVQSFNDSLRCIYCNLPVEQCGNLTDEHIIPYALGGNVILKESSCKSCAAITSRFEANILRGPFRAFKEKLGIQTRSKKRPKKFPLFCINGDENHRIDVPLEHYPVTIQLPHIKGPYIADFDSKERASEMPWVFAEQIQLETLYLQYGIKSFACNEINVAALGRLLAKIAHCFAIREFGVDGFVPFLQGVILGHSEESYHRYIGSVSEAMAKTGGQLKHKARFWIEQAGGAVFITCHVQLFASLGAPKYRVVVGQRREDFSPQRNFPKAPSHKYGLTEPRLRLSISTVGFENGGGQPFVPDALGKISNSIS